MFPVSDFNFMVCGIATFAATIGYACSRKMSTGRYVKCTFPVGNKISCLKVLSETTDDRILQSLMLPNPKTYWKTQPHHQMKPSKFLEKNL